MYMNITTKFIISMLLIVAAAVYVFPYQHFGINVNDSFMNKPYVLGLDLQGGVELDYQVDLSHVHNNSGATSSTTGLSASTSAQENVVVEGLKKIIDKRVNSLGLAEPNIQTLKYGNDTHIVVQIPTESYANLSPHEQEARQKQDIENAKSVIGKVVSLEFREMRTHTTDEEYAARKQLAEHAKSDLETLDFGVLSQKYNMPADGVMVKTGTGTIPDEAKVPSLSGATVENFPFITNVETVVENREIIGSGANSRETITSTGYVTLRLDEKLGDNQYRYSYVRVNHEPGMWMAAKTADGRILNDEYLQNATAYLDPTSLQPKVSLLFNPEGSKMFGEISTRLIGQQLAIFVGGEMVMSANVNQAIMNGQAEISGGYATLADAQEVADNITTGIVPAPIYLTSERTIDAKIGATALSQIVTAGAIGLVAIVVFLVIFYHVGGLLAGVALIAYTLFLIAIVKMSGVVLTLAAIAGVILSIGLAIDANILIFERTREALREKMPLSKAISIGFEHSWNAIWDSHITSFVSALILYIVGVSLIKGFGFMLGIGILLSLFTAMWVSRVLIQFVSKYIKNPVTLFGKDHKK